jgi:Flp pilus assembly protein TadD
MKTALALALLIALSGCAATSQPPQAVYGRPPALTSAPLSLEQATSEANVGQTLAVKAPAAEVCQNKGCWMVLTEGARSIRVTFQDYGFFVPKDIAGKTVVVEGVLSRKLLSADEAKHYAEESAPGAAAPPGPREEWSLVATSVVVPVQ